MKKILFIFLVAICLVCCLSLTACNNDEPESIINVEPSYELTLCYDGAKNIEFNEEIMFSSIYQMDDIKLHLYPNAFSNETSNSPIDKSQWKKVRQFGKIDILSVQIDRQSCDYAICGTDNTILSIPFQLDTNTITTISIQGTITIPECVARFGVNNYSTNLTGFYPVLCVNENGVWRDDCYSSIGDPFFSDISSFYVNVSYPTDYTLATCGQVATTVNDNTKTSDIVAEHIRDFAMVFSKQFEMATTIADISNGVEINYYYTADTNYTLSLQVAKSALETFSKTFGDYPYSTYTIVQAPINAGGMEYGSMAIFSTADEQIIIHETAHQWWYGVVGNDQINDAWLDEGLAEFSTYYFYALTGHDDIYHNNISVIYNEYNNWKSKSTELCMTKSLHDYTTNSEYVALNYIKGAIMFDTLRELIGDAKLTSALSNYYATNKYKIATSQSLLDCFDQVSPNISNVITTFLSGNELINVVE